MILEIGLFTNFQRKLRYKLFPNVPQICDVADNVNEVMKIKFNITSVFSAEKLNGNSAKQLL